MKYLCILFFFGTIVTFPSEAQTVGKWLPKKIDPKGSYLFYLHGGIVTNLGNNAVQQSYPEWGPYRYLDILDTLSTLGFNVISENRKLDIDDSVYVNRIAKQIDSLLHHGAKEKNILVLGASAGWSIGLNVSGKVKNKQLNYVLMGGCWPETYKEFQNIRLIGHFLSIIEETDPHKTCSAIFDKRNEFSSFKEIELHTGRSHGFFYQPRKEWIEPIVAWMKK